MNTSFITLENELRVFTWIVKNDASQDDIKKMMDCYCEEYGTEAVAEWLIANASIEVMNRLNEVA